MKIRIMSDLHLEMGHMHLSPGGDVLVLAGDIGVVDKPSYLNLIDIWSEMFTHIIYVTGNHEYYKGDIDKSLKKLKTHFADTNVHLLENDHVFIDDVAFIGATLWSDFPTLASEHCANSYMNDFRIIRRNNYAYGFRAEDARAKFDISSAYIRSALGKLREQGFTKIVVVTHHAPSRRSISPRFAGHLLNDAFASDLEELIETGRADLWIHGHTHDSFDYKVHDTRVICNPRGYVGYELNDNFDKTLMVEL